MKYSTHPSPILDQPDGAGRTAFGRAGQRSRAFTLIELLVAMGIIVILLGAGMLAFNSLTGRRSTAMAKNQVAAMLSRARTFAINDTSTEVASYGVFFFLDPETDRTAMAFMRHTPLGGGDPDPHDNYKGWTHGGGVVYRVGDRVVAVVKDNLEDGRPMVRRFRCILEHTSSLGTRPPITVTTVPASNGYWEEVVDGSTSFLDEPVELLPAGVGLQTFTGDTAALNTDRYLRAGAILFDRQGRLEYQSYVVSETSPIGLRLQLIDDLPSSTTTPVYSQVGMVIYDLEAFRAVSFHSEGDVHSNMNIPDQDPPANYNDERNEEKWLDDNGSLYFVNRYSGELTQVR